MTAETREIVTDLRAVWGETFPTRPCPSKKEFSDEILVLGVLIRREIQLATHPLKLLKPGFAEGIEPRITVKSKPKRKLSE